MMKCGFLRAWALVLLLTTGSSPSISEGYRLDDRGTFSVPAVPVMQWQAWKGTGGRSLMSGQFDLHLKLNVSSWVGRKVRVYLSLVRDQDSALDMAWGPGSTLQGGAGLQAQSTLLGHTWSQEHWNTQFRAIRSVHSEGILPSTTTVGWWGELAFEHAYKKQAFGAYRLDPSLRWGAQPLPSDLQGVFYRGEWARRQWNIEGGLDRLSSIDRADEKGYYATAFGRYRLDRRSNINAGLSLRDYLETGVSAFADWRWLNDLGNSGLRLEADTRKSAEVASERTSWVRFDQDWDTTGIAPMATLSSSAGMGRAWSPEQGWSNLLTVNLNWAMTLSDRIQLRGTLGAERAGARWDYQHYSVGATWELTPRWSLEGFVHQSAGTTRQLLSLDPLATQSLPLTARQSGRYVYALLRYSFDAGARTQFLGTRADRLAGGGGRISGQVFFDGNRSEIKEASEEASSGLVVVLDDRYITTTDTQGRFEYPRVAAGRHRISIQKDSIPLPWSAPEDGGHEFEVEVRGVSVISIPLRRTGP